MVCRIDRSQESEYTNKNYFLAQLLGVPYPLKKTVIDNTNSYYVGWWVVDVQWYDWKNDDDAGNK